jgi:hypothetical protein
MLLPNVFRYTQSLVEESIRSSWVAANGLFGAGLAGAAMIWHGVLPLFSTDLTSVPNWVMSFVIYAIGSWIVLFVSTFLLIAPYRSWQKVALIINNLDASYVTRFRDGSDIAPMIPGGVTFGSPNLSLWGGLRVRVIRLNEFIKELSV